MRSPSLLLRRSLHAGFALALALAACGGGSGDPDPGGAGGGTGGTLDCGPIPGAMDCVDCNGDFTGPVCDGASWGCPTYSCPILCPPDAECFDCHGNPTPPSCSSTGDWMCPDDCPSLASPPALWAGLATGAGSQGGQAVAVAPDGTVVLGGSFGGQITIGGVTYTTPEPGNIYQVDALLTKLGPDGSVLWSHAFGALGDDFVHDVAVDAAGNVIAVGTYESAQTLGAYSLPGGQVGGVFVVKLAPNGDLLFAKGFAGGANGTRARLAVTPGGDILLAGDTSGTIDFGGGPIAGGNGSEAFVARLDPSGNHVYSHRWAAESAAEDIAVGPSGDAFVLGTFSGAVDFGLGALTSKGSFDVFLLRLDAGGAVIGSVAWGGPGDDRAGSVVTDSQGNVTFTATYADGADFGGGALPATERRGLLASVTPTFAPRWALPYGRVEQQLSGGDVFRLAVDGADRIVVAGQFVDAFDGGGDLPHAVGDMDLILGTVSPAGVWLAAHAYGSADADWTRGVAVDPSTGDAVITGATWGALDLGLGPMKPGGYGDMFWARFAAHVE